MGESLTLDFGLGSEPGRYGQDTGPRHWNAIVEAKQKGKVPAPIYVEDGFTVFSPGRTFAANRGMVVLDDTTMYALLGTVFTKIGADGQRTGVGNIAGTARAIMARNEASTVQIAIVIDGNKFICSNDTVTTLSDADLPAANSCTFLNRKIIFGIDDGRFFWSAVDDSTSISALDFAEAEGNPDGGVRVIAHLQELWIFGTESIEVWYDNGDGFTRRTGVVIPKGCLGKHKHTIAELDKDLFWVGNDNVVYAAAGYGFERISTDYLEELIRLTQDKSTLVATAYFKNGTGFYVLSSDEWSWAFNRTLSQSSGQACWSERFSKGGTRWKGNGAVNFANRVIIGSKDDDALYQMSQAAFTEAGEEIIWRVRCAPMHAFPNQICVDRLHLDLFTGFGLNSTDEKKSDPRIGLRWSDDGGRTWSNQLFRSLGKIGKGMTRVTFDALGLTGVSGRIWELESSSPTVRGLMQAKIEGDLNST